MVDIDLLDPEWFPVDLDVATGSFHLLKVSAKQLEDATFLDNRLDVDWQQATLLPAPAFPEMASLPAWLWHTSFCGSTLLSQLLHVPPWTMSLREPLVLRRLSDARAANRPWRDFVAPAAHLLSRPWTSGGQVVIKPTHAALNVAAELMAVCPASKGVVLTSSLEDFVISHLKKSSQTLEKIPTLAGRALSAGHFHERLDAAAINPPDMLCAAALQWAAQRELLGDLLVAMPERLRVVDFGVLQRAPLGCVSDCAEFLGLPTPGEALAGRVREAATVHAKAPGRAYDGRTRDAESRWLLSQHEAQVRRALQWADNHLLPNMREVALCLETT